MDQIARGALAVLLLTACSTTGGSAPEPTPSHPGPVELAVVEQAVVLQVPAGVVPEVYRQIRADATLGAALDRQMIPALERAGAPGERLAGFAAARDAALVGWAPAADPEGAASQRTGPMVSAEHRLRSGFDQVSTDVLRQWFIQIAEAVATAGPRDQAIATLHELEARARRSFGWDASAAESVGVRVMLVRAQLEQRP